MCIDLQSWLPWYEILFKEEKNQIYNLKIVYTNWSSGDASNIKTDLLVNTFKEEFSLSYHLSWFYITNDIHQFLSFPVTLKLISNMIKMKANVSIQWITLALSRRTSCNTVKPAQCFMNYLYIELIYSVIFLWSRCLLCLPINDYFIGTQCLVGYGTCPQSGL